jgi:hypothetical protein
MIGVYWSRRLSGLEIAVYAVIVGVALAVFLERFLYYMELAERSSMELTVSNVNSALNVMLAYNLLAGRPADGRPTTDRSPFELATMSPANFHGNIEAPRLAALERGYWVFDRSRSELIYLPRLHRGLRTADPEDAIRFRLSLKPGNGYMLVPTSKYEWN